MKGGKAVPVARAGQVVRGTTAKVGNPKFITLGRPGPPDPRRQERAVALAAGRQDVRPGHARPGQRHPVVELGRRRPGDRRVHPERRPGPLQPVRRRPVVEADPGLFAGLRRLRLPGRPDELAGRAAGRLGGRRDGHRRRHLPVAVGHDRPLRPRRHDRLEAGRSRRRSSCARRPPTPTSRRARSRTPGRSTATTRRIAGSSPCRRTAARSRRSTGSRATTPAGPTCAGSTSCRVPATSPTRSSGSTRTGS